MHRQDKGNSFSRNVDKLILHVAKTQQTVI